MLTYIVIFIFHIISKKTDIWTYYARMENEEINFTQKTSNYLYANTVTLNALSNPILTDICLPVNIRTVSMEIWWK